MTLSLPNAHPKYLLVEELLKTIPENVDGLNDIIVQIGSMMGGFRSNDDSIVSPIHLGGKLPGLYAALEGEEQPLFLSIGLPALFQEARRLPELFPKGCIPVIRPGGVAVLKKEWIPCLLAHMLLCSIAPAPFHSYWANFAPWLLSTLEPPKMYLQALFSLFNRPLDNIKDVHVERFVLPPETKWNSSEKLLIPFPVVVKADATMDQVDTASEMVFSHRVPLFGTWNTQEEVVWGFCSTILFVPLLIDPCLQKKEVLRVRGLQVMEHQGVGKTLAMGRLIYKERRLVFVDALEVDTAVIEGQDALSFQWKWENIEREMGKAMAALWNQRTMAIGAWGCGAFGGDVDTKLLLLLMASAVVDTQPTICLCGDPWGIVPRLMQCITFAKENEWTIAGCVHFLKGDKKSPLLEDMVRRGE